MEWQTKSTTEIFRCTNNVLSDCNHDVTDLLNHLINTLTMNNIVKSFSGSIFKGSIPMLYSFSSELMKTADRHKKKKKVTEMFKSQKRVGYIKPV